MKTWSLLVIFSNGSRLRLVRKAVMGKLEVIVRKWIAPDREPQRRRMPKLSVFDDAAVAEKLRSQFRSAPESPCF